MGKRRDRWTSTPLDPEPPCQGPHSVTQKLLIQWQPKGCCRIKQIHCMATSLTQRSKSLPSFGIVVACSIQDTVVAILAPRETRRYRQYRIRLPICVQSYQNFGSKPDAIQLPVSILEQ